MQNLSYHECWVALVMSDSVDLKDCNLPGSSVYGIVKARILEWVAMPSSWESSQPRYQTQVFFVSCIGRQVLHH